MDTTDRLLVVALILVVVIAVSVIATALLRRRHQIELIDPADLAADTDVVVFTSPYCHGCRQWIAALDEAGVATQAIDIGERPEAAARYRISSTPRVVVVDRRGTVTREFDHYTPREHDMDAIARIVRS